MSPLFDLAPPPAPVRPGMGEPGLAGGVLYGDGLPAGHGVAGMTLAAMGTLPIYVLFASAGKHAMDNAVRFRRYAVENSDYWIARHWLETSERVAAAAWSHLEAARDAKQRFVA